MVGGTVDGGIDVSGVKFVVMSSCSGLDCWWKKNGSPSVSESCAGIPWLVAARGVPATA